MTNLLLIYVKCKFIIGSFSSENEEAYVFTINAERFVNIITLFFVTQLEDIAFEDVVVTRFGRHDITPPYHSLWVFQ